MLVNEFLQCRRRTAADFLNQITRPGEDTVLMIDGDFTQMLDGEGISLTFGFWFELAIESPRVMPRPLKRPVLLIQLALPSGPTSWK